ncbi:MAG TPA: primosomal protein N' [Longimicrobiales bacterium]|nr:primosomal protein N' [Longimicrobiales bacterium]
MPTTLVEVALPLPIPRTFTYQTDERVASGSRVLVPFARRTLIGWVTGETQGEPDTTRIRAVKRVLDPTPAVPADLMRLCAWIADYYLAPLGLVLRSALPAALSRPERSEPPIRTTRVLRLVAELPSLSQRDTVFRRAARQRELFELLEAMDGAAEVPHLTERLGFSTSVLNGLVDKGLARLDEKRVRRDPFAEMPRDVEVVPPLTAEQQAVVAPLLAAASRDAAAPKPFLLRGVTGSGKTRVYLELLDEVVRRQGRGAIVLVPEIALTPQTVARFRARFGDDIAVLHSALSDGERYDAWDALRQGRKRIAIGARSAVFAPVRDLGAIVVDEEHEGSYKQSEAPRYHAREVAVVRSTAAGAVCVLGSATPSLESWNNARTGKFELIELHERIGELGLPEVRVIDLREGRRDSDERERRTAQPGRRDRAPARGAPPVLSPPLVEAIAERLRRHEQTILLLNRRGYSTFVQCRGCGEVWACPDCNVSLTYHRGRRRLVCHYCLHEEAPPATCRRCGEEVVVYRGVGTEQVERTVAETFPDARVARMDIDTTSAKWSHHRILERFGAADIDILLGTQMIAKGLDFPNVTLVGVVNADVGINLPDFRATERTFQLLTQVAGRAGRGLRGGLVLVQTSLPRHYAIERSLSHDFVGFAERELEERRGPCYPPHCRLINVIVSGEDQKSVEDAIATVAHWTLSSIARDARAVTLIGPAPCPIDRIRGRWRWHFLLRSPNASPLGRVGRALLEDYPSLGGDLRLVLDRDPVSLL